MFYSLLNRGVQNIIFILFKLFTAKERGKLAYPPYGLQLWQCSRYFTIVTN